MTKLSNQIALEKKSKKKKNKRFDWGCFSKARSCRQDGSFWNFKDEMLVFFSPKFLLKPIIAMHTIQELK